MAEAQGVSVRTLRNWKALDPAAARRRPGRPRVPEDVRREVRRRVRAVLEEQGWMVGERVVKRVLGEVPISRIRVALRGLKAEQEARVREVRLLHRTSMRVVLGDAVWALDATHLGRDRERHAVLAEVLREVHSTRTIGLSVGREATEDDVIALLERTARERGTLPLVLVTDNAGAYCGAKVARWLAVRGIVHLKNLPRTPQHNPAAEHGMGELKGVSELGKGVVTTNEDALLRLEAAREKIDEHRLRPTRGWRTAAQADEESLPWHCVLDRWAFYRDVTCAIGEAVKQSTGKRAKRRAEREAILSTLERHRAITRTRGGASGTAQ